jgi:hypothetical protein
MPRLTIVPVFQDSNGTANNMQGVENLPPTPVKPSHGASKSTSPLAPMNNNILKPLDYTIIDNEADDIPPKPVRSVLLCCLFACRSDSHPIMLTNRR